MSPPWKRRPGATLLGLAVDRESLEFVELRRTNGSSEIRRSVTLPFPAAPLAADPEALGRLLRKQLDEAGIRESRCAVALPAHAAMSLTVAVPDLPDADRQSFLEIEAERAFPQSPENLILQTSLLEPRPGHQQATLLAFERTAIERLEAALRAARLKPITFTLGLPSLQPPIPDGPKSVLALLPSGPNLEILVTSGSGIAAFRVLEDAFAPREESPALQPDLDRILREIRITLGQLPADVRDALHAARVFGPSDTARAFAEVLTSRLSVIGLSVELVPTLHGQGLPFRLPTHAPATPALAVAVDAAAGRRPLFEFLPPRISAWQQWAARYPSRRLAWAGAAAGAVAAIVCLLFGIQQILLWRGQTRWDAIKNQVTRIEGMQIEVRRYSPWFDDSVRSLSILRRLSEAFPEDGSVSAKSIEIRGPSRVSCSGTAQNPQAWLRMLDNVRGAPGIVDVQVEQVRGKAPLEFSFNFVWQGSPGS